MIKNTQFLYLLLLLIWTVPQAIRAELDLKDGDAFVFLGDSITHRGAYSQYIETFYATRYPERRIRFINAGIGGDKAADALARFEEDVAIFNPQYVSVMLGMNDGQYKDFSQEIFGTYREDMEAVLQRIEAIGAQAIIISPTIFDQQQYALRYQEPDFRFIRLHASDHYNGTMALFGAWMRERAMSEHLDYVNLWGPLNDLTTTQRRSDPLFTFVEDAIHPGPIGHAIMASAFLEALAPKRKNVSAVTARFQNRKWRVNATNAEITNIEGVSDRLRFSMKANSLPWVLPEEAALGYKLSKSGHRLSNESLSVAGLDAGSYEITIDGQKLPKQYTHFTLGRKIELQANPDTPQYQQAAHVATLVKERFEKALVPYRNLRARMIRHRREHGKDAPEVAEFREEHQSELDRLLALADDYSQRIFIAAQPETRRYSLARIAGPGRK